MRHTQFRSPKMGAIELLLNMYKRRLEELVIARDYEGGPREGIEEKKVKIARTRLLKKIDELITEGR